MEKEKKEDLEMFLEKKENELLEFERVLNGREREFQLQQELIECLEKRNRELEEELARAKQRRNSTTTRTNNDDFDDGKEEEEEQNLNSPVYDAVASMFGRFTGLGGTTTTTTTTTTATTTTDDDAAATGENKKKKKGDFRDDDYDGEEGREGEREGIVNIVVSEDENKSGGTSRVSFVPGLVSVKDKRRLMFAVVDAEIDARQFVGLRRMSKEEKERMTASSTTSGSGNGKKQGNRHLKTLAQYLMHRSASQENLGATTNGDGINNDGGENSSSSSSPLEMYEILWKEDGEMKRLAFEANAEGFIHVSKRVQKWSEEAKSAVEAMPADALASNTAPASASASSAIEKEEEKQTRRILEPMPKSQVTQQPELIGYAVKNAPIIDQTIQSCYMPKKVQRL